MDDPKWTMRGLGNDLNFIIITEHKLTTMTLCSVVETLINLIDSIQQYNGARTYGRPIHGAIFGDELPIHSSPS